MLWKVDTESRVETWIQESHELAKAFAYSPEIVDALKRPGDLAPLSLPQSYLKAAGEHARQRIVAAGLRLARELGRTSPNQQ